MGELLEEINSITTELKENFTTLSDKLENVNKDLRKLNTSIATGANFTVLPNVTRQLNSISDINDKNLTENAVKVSLNLVASSVCQPN